MKSLLYHEIVQTPRKEFLSQCRGRALSITWYTKTKFEVEITLLLYFFVRLDNNMINCNPRTARVIRINDLSTH